LGFILKETILTSRIRKLLFWFSGVVWEPLPHKVARYNPRKVQPRLWACSSAGRVRGGISSGWGTQSPHPRGHSGPGQDGGHPYCRRARQKCPPTEEDGGVNDGHTKYCAGK